MYDRGEEWVALGYAALAGGLWVLRDPGFVRLWGALFPRNANEAAPAILVTILGLITPAFLFRQSSPSKRTLQHMTSRILSLQYLFTSTICVLCFFSNVLRFAFIL